MGAEVFVSNLVFTVFAYGLGPILLVLVRKKKITKAKIRAFHILYTIGVAFCFQIIYVLTDASSGAGNTSPAFLWGIIFYTICIRTYRKDGRLIEKTTGEAPSIREPANAATSKEEPREVVLTYVQRPNASPRDVPKKRSWNCLAYGVIAVFSLVIFLCGAHIVQMKATIAALQESLVGYEQQISDAKRENSLLSTKTKNLQDQIDSLKSRLSDADSQLDELQEESIMLNCGIGFIVSGSKYYHSYHCQVYQSASEYWAHNVEYCEYLGYTSCPRCW